MYQLASATVPRGLAALLCVLAACGEAETESSHPTARSDRHQAEPAAEDDQRTYLTVADAAHFKPSRSRQAILEELKWPKGCVAMAYCGDDAVCNISFDLVFDTSNPVAASVWIDALFVNERFEKFVHRPPDGPWSSSLSDFDWLHWLPTAPSADIDALRQAILSQKAPDQQVDWGLTVAWLLVGPKLRDAPNPPATPEDRQRNFQLRRQFNAARLWLGMTEEQVVSALGATAIEEGLASIGSYKLYGSKDMFNVDPAAHFSNILVVYNAGKASIVQDVGSYSQWSDCINADK